MSSTPVELGGLSNRIDVVRGGCELTVHLNHWHVQGVRGIRPPSNPSHRSSSVQHLRPHPARILRTRAFCPTCISRISFRYCCCSVKFSAWVCVSSRVSCSVVLLKSTVLTATRFTEQMRVRLRASCICVGVRTTGCGIAGVLHSQPSNYRCIRM